MKAWLTRNLNKDRKTDAPKRKSVVPLWRRKSTVMASIVGVLGLCGGAVTWAVQSGWAEQRLSEARWAAIGFAAEQGFTVQEVLVSGRGETKRDELLAALRVARGTPVLAYDFKAAKARVEALPWVLHVRIERLLPDTLAVHLIERRPIALWQHEGRFALIDEEGQVITRKNLGRFADMFQVVGADAPDHVGGLLELLDTQPALRRQVKVAVRVGGRRWDLALKGGVNVRLPEDDVAQAWARLARFDAETQVLARDVRVLDLRVPDRVIVRRAQDAKPKSTPAKPGQKT